MSCEGIDDNENWWLLKSLQGLLNFGELVPPVSKINRPVGDHQTIQRILVTMFPSSNPANESTTAFACEINNIPLLNVSPMPGLPCLDASREVESKKWLSTPRLSNDSSERSLLDNPLNQPIGWMNLEGRPWLNKEIIPWSWQLWNLNYGVQPFLKRTLLKSVVRVIPRLCWHHSHAFITSTDQLLA